MSELILQKPAFGRFVAAGAAAGAASALLNSAYFLAHRALTGLRVSEPTLASIVLSSLFPSILGALGYALLSRFTRHATPLFVSVTTAITVASFASALESTLPSGDVKPGCFDALVMPMHLVVGALAVVLI